MKSLIYVFIMIALSLFSLSEDKWESFPLPETPGIVDNTVTNLITTPEGRIFMVSIGGFYQLFNNEWTNILKDTPFNDGNHANIKSLTYDPTGIIWGASEMGFMKYTIGTNSLEYLDKSTMSADETGAYGYLNGMTIDKNNNIWSVSRTPYLSKFDGEKFTDWDIYYENKILAINYWSATMIRDKADNIWVSGDDGVMKVATNSTANSLNFVKYSLEDLKISDGGIIDIYFDSKNRIWVSGLKGEISYFDGSNWIEIPIPEEMLGVKNEYGNFSIQSILENNSGEMLFFWGCAGFYLSYGTDGILKKNLFPAEITDDYGVISIFDASIDNDGDLLIGTYGKSLVKVSKSSSVEDTEYSYMSLNPTPAMEYVEIKSVNQEFFNQNKNKLTVSIYNCLGELVKDNISIQNLPCRIDISDFFTGVYFIKAGYNYYRFVKI